MLVDKTEEMIGSYGPSASAYEKKFQLEEAPSGLLVRGHYDAKVRIYIADIFALHQTALTCVLQQSKFIDDDGVTHVEWNWSFDIKKDW